MTRHSKSKRDDMAKMALHIAMILPAAEAARAIMGMFQVGETTARRLILRGRHLAINGETK
jgi:hypothetical protein